jgi:signal transduction histidine kinase
MTNSSQQTQQRQILGQAAFSVSARVAMQLGRESISSSIVAILELVKNAYDADAENVVIHFTDMQGFKPSLSIRDDGIGMTLDQVRDNWMVIGTNNKVLSRSSRSKNRVLVGEKGLGRLGLDRLAHQSKVLTFVEEQDFGVELDIDWTKYEERATGRLEEITHDIYKIPKEVTDPTSRSVIEVDRGTYLELDGLKDKWTKSDIEKLYEELSLLVSPFGGVNDFSIWLYTDVPEWDEYNGAIDSKQYLTAAEWTLESSMTADGRIVHNLTSHHNSLSFQFDQNWTDVIRDSHVEDQPRCGPVSFKMYFFDRTNVDLTTAQVKKFLGSNQGVRIYRDNFRVKPYGDPSASGEGDWLNLNARRIANPAGVGDMLKKWNVAYNQVVGAAFITRSANSNLLDQTNREGIVEGPGYYDLRRYILNAVEFFESERQKYERSQKKRRQIEETREQAQNKTKAVIGATNRAKDTWEQVLDDLEKSSKTGTPPDLSAIRERVNSSIIELEEKAEESERTQEQLIRESEQQEEEYEQQKNTLGNLASLGILAAAFGHETVGYSNEVISNIDLLREDILDLFPVLYQDEHHAVLRDIDKINQSAHRINTFASFTLASVLRDKRKSKEINLFQIVTAVFNALDLTKIYNIEVEINFSDDLSKIRAFQIDWESIFINLITNAKWAIDSVRKTDHKRKIRVDAFRTSDTVCIQFSDSGCGIPDHEVDRIYEPGFSTKRNQRGDVIGTGMGLAIVRNFVVESYKGKIDVDSSLELGGARFTIQIPLPPSQQNGNQD